MSTSRQSRRRLRRREGFTLLELLLVMTILVVLAGIGTVAYNKLGVNQKVRAATFEIDNIKKICRMYEMEVGSPPRSLQDLVTLPSGVNKSSWSGPYFEDAKIPVDPWKNQYSFSYNANQDQLIITSNGADGAKGTADDIPVRGQ